MVWSVGVAVSCVGELSGEQEFKIEANEKTKINREIASFINNKKIKFKAVYGCTTKEIGKWLIWFSIGSLIYFI